MANSQQELLVQSGIRPIESPLADAHVRTDPVREDKLLRDKAGVLAAYSAEEVLERSRQAKVAYADGKPTTSEEAVTVFRHVGPISPASLEDDAIRTLRQQLSDANQQIAALRRDRLITERFAKAAEASANSYAAQNTELRTQLEAERQAFAVALDRLIVQFPILPALPSLATARAE